MIICRRDIFKITYDKELQYLVSKQTKEASKLNLLKFLVPHQSTTSYMD